MNPLCRPNDLVPSFPKRSYSGQFVNDSMHGEDCTGLLLELFGLPAVF